VLGFCHLFKRRAKPTRERRWLPDVEPAAERQRAPSEWLTADGSRLSSMAMMSENR